MINEADLTFEVEKIDGIVPVGTYLSDAGARFGIAANLSCDQVKDEHQCQIEIKEGRDLLSAPTSVESEILSRSELKKGMRLGCQARIESSGEVVVMTKQTKDSKSKKPEEKDPVEYSKEFRELPLEKKISTLLELEAIALGETFSFILNSPYQIADKVMDVMAEFGYKQEKDEKRSARPKEHTQAKEEDSKEESNEAH